MDLGDNQGLVNLITHPDYLDTPARLRMYEEFLVYLAAQSDGWHALPRDVASWWRTHAGLRCEERAGEVVITGPGAERATLAWAREVGGELVVEPQPVSA